MLTLFVLVRKWLSLGSVLGWIMLLLYLIYDEEYVDMEEVFRPPPYYFLLYFIKKIT